MDNMWVKMLQSLYLDSLFGFGSFEAPCRVNMWRELFFLNVTTVNNVLNIDVFMTFGFSIRNIVSDWPN